ncbi:MAG: CBS domain-containing protein [bacterium]
MIRFKEMYLSNLLGMSVMDVTGKRIGEVYDVAIKLGEIFPKVSGLVCTKKTKGRLNLLPIANVGFVSRSILRLNKPVKEIKYCRATKNDLLLKQNLMDKQIVDTNDYKVVRVNDLKLTRIGTDIRLVGADVGFLGILRRFGLERAVQSLMQLLRIPLREDVIPWNLVQPMQSQLAKLQLNISHTKLAKLHPSDIAHIISQLPFEEQVAVFQSISVAVAAEVLHELEGELQKDIIAIINARRAAEILEIMPPDEAADVLGKLSPEKVRGFLRLMKKRVAEELSMLMKHSADTAGGLMTTEFIALPQNLTVEETIEKLRDLAPSAETIYYLFVVDSSCRLVGVLSLRKLIVSPPDQCISEIMNPKVLSVAPNRHQREVADIISKYNLLAVPVVDKESRLMGIITVDDVLDIFLPSSTKRKPQRLG